MSQGGILRAVAQEELEGKCLRRMWMRGERVAGWAFVAGEGALGNIFEGGAFLVQQILC